MGTVTVSAAKTSQGAKQVFYVPINFVPSIMSSANDDSSFLLSDLSAFCFFLSGGRGWDFPCCVD